MIPRLRTFLVPLVALVALATLGVASAQGCARGALAPGFCDTDGDLLADLPTDPGEWAHPDALIFAYTPGDDPAVDRDVWADFLAHLERATGWPVHLSRLDSVAELIEAMRTGRLHVAGFDARSVPLAVNAAGFRPFAMMAAADVRVINASPPFLTTVYGLAHDLDPELVAKIQEGFFSFLWAGSGLEAAFGEHGEARFSPITYLEHGAVIRQIDEGTDVVDE